MPLPAVDFLGIGAQRAGTTWLFRCLIQHPQLYLPGTKELHYFDRLAGLAPRFTKVRSVWSGLIGQGPAERDWRRQFGSAIRDVVRHGLSIEIGRELVRQVSYHLPGAKDDAWYRRQFANAGARLKGEVTPAYAILDDAGVRHVTRLSPEVKVIFILRDPLSRTLSHWQLDARDDERLGLQPLVDLAAFSTLPYIQARNDYLHTIDTWGAHVPRERFFIGWYDDTRADPERMLRRVMTFLGVDPDEPRVLRMARTRDRRPMAVKPVVPPEVLREMARASRPGIAAVAERLGGHALGWLERCDAILAGGNTGG